MNNPLRKARTGVEILFLTAITLLFFDFTGSVHVLLGWMARIQFIPAILAVNVGVVVGLVILTLLFGRIYCSMVCPLGVVEDVVSAVASRRKRNRFRYSPSIKWLRYGVLGVFVVAFIAGLGSVVALLEPYAAYGRIASNLFAPLYQWGNNMLAYFAERAESYMFYDTEVWVKSLGTFVVAAVTLLVVSYLAWRNGRSYCNTICPVGTILGFLSAHSLFRHRIDKQRCNGCGACARNCKSSCINPKAHEIDYSRCVTCFDCIDKCKQNAISYRFGIDRKSVSKDYTDSSRRNMLAASATLLTTAVLRAQEKKVDGGLAFIEDKRVPERQTPIVPPGARSLRDFTQKCTGCQLCVSVCKNNVLRPSNSLTTFLQPEVSYERGYCRPECVSCSQVCPTGAIGVITTADKSATQVGHAIWIEKNCVVLTDGVECGNCANHCPTGAVTMAQHSPEDSGSGKIPIINTERCIGCGACENLCPARPFSAIYVEGHVMHRTI